MTIIAIQITAFFVFAWAALYFLFRAVPEQGRRASLCMLHNLRDHLYLIHKTSVTVEQSLFYEDILFSLTYLIHLVRDHPREITLSLVMRVLAPKHFANACADKDFEWRAKRYTYEMENLFTGAEAKKELQDALMTYRRKDAVLLFYIITSHPLFFIPAVCLCVAMLFVPVVGCLWLFCIKRYNDIMTISQTLNVVRAHRPTKLLHARS